ncbi:PepSY domain-containing protein [Stackebrandtia nassauensis]|uniref:PepSY domain-containing protein n=1 Tax=Stackebrandtia nassauensis (strain DSM 44728 / CIP 108903 / NRRL B-16338 / NBRC 102104 / LLR-40K-21) TaxID=446470 RepID=D3Q9U8_STANL|nr:PepSY domain-containing protein [Stackebrandtia nassauensis]ADD44644.1 hypothetical protein Snas_5007 [Stackebrandtia nassauensis DSM 44728]
MSLLSHRRALVLAGLTGMLLAGGTLATATAAQANDTSPTDNTKLAPIPSATLDIAEAADKAEAKYPDCEATAALFYDTANTPIWDVELTCASGTIKYVTVDANSGTVADNGSTTDDTTDSTNPTDPTDPSDSTKSDKSEAPGSDKKNPSDNNSSASDSGDARGTGKNADD